MAKNNNVELAMSSENKIKLNSFHPLCETMIGLRAVEELRFPPFIDGSCRREPDFEHKFPSISALCRQGVFAPHLKEGDIVVYMTVGGIVPPYKLGHHIVAILQVEKVFPTHKDGEHGYLADGLSIPSNCMSSSHGLHKFEETMGNYKNQKEMKSYLRRDIAIQKKIGAKRIVGWNERYLDKSVRWQCFVKTRKVYLNLIDPPVITDSHFKQIFGKLPNTRTPCIVSVNELMELGKVAGLDINLEFSNA